MTSLYRFIDKIPCLAPRMVDETLCLPLGPHRVVDYPVCYDPLYYLHEYPSYFEIL
ncbi:hypothetical protein PAXRUDRAFT_834238 [Paxillus rubicundulus Ve08.2h10]|uniref:Unplaced genomic scaffold scaffold_1540, whole genome shotgun sequence n=1 Tax=Paxillus rubicundulus Ve08.2h10 TaxID=930991 RepID=A0A0D0CUL6_9AGAM|nr:hypothetical protein PAXRUDRAFT_834238 [Paxillus rubicundulus Ve08.2h10]